LLPTFATTTITWKNISTLLPTFASAPKEVITTPSPSSTITIVVRTLDEDIIIVVDGSCCCPLTIFEL